MSYVQISPNSTDETLIFEVLSSSRNIIHECSFDINNGWHCSCEQYSFRKDKCRHMKEAQEYYKKFYKIMDTDFVFKPMKF